MAIGTSGDYWSKRNLPSIFKHELLRVYLPVFMSRLSTNHELAYIDGFAGEGRYEDGTPGSAEMAITIANNLAKQFDREFHLHYREKDKASYTKLEEVLAEITHPRVKVDAKKGDISTDLPSILALHPRRPLLAFLDPCGFGAPYDLLVQTMNRNEGRPPTELLLNFSHHAIRRNAGLKEGRKGTQAAHQRITDTVGGPWWKDWYQQANTDEDFGSLIAEQFAQRLTNDTNAAVSTIPVRKAPNQMPIYSLVHVTRSDNASFHIFNAVARAHEKWWDAIEALDEATGEMSLFPRRLDMNTFIHNSQPYLQENIQKILEERAVFTVAEEAATILGKHLGDLPYRAITTALKSLEKENQIIIDRVKPKVEYWKIRLAKLP